MTFIRWPSNIEEAKEMQNELMRKVMLVPREKAPRLIAGIDVAFLESHAIGVASLFTYPDLFHIEDRHAVTDVHFPYIPGFLSFREGPAMVCALSHFKKKPDIILVDGQGIAHPKGLGIASFIGVILNMPTVGCAKSRLIGDYSEPCMDKGCCSTLTYKERTIGSVLRTRERTRPVFVSPGHMTDLDHAIQVVMTCAVRYRIPEPLRRADHLSKIIKKKILTEKRS